MSAVTWDKLNKFKYYGNTVIFFSGVRVFFYPIVLLKTRMQVQKDGYYTGIVDSMKKIFKREGIKGFYKGFGVSLIGVIPAQLTYLSSFEMSKFYITENFPNLPASGLAGGIASLSSGIFAVPIDVIVQRLMIQDGVSSEGKLAYTGGFNAVKTIYMTEGIKGFFRGYGATIVTYAPSSALWWTTYGAVRPIFEAFSEDPFWQVAVTPIVGGISAIVSYTATNPLDIAKTRLQTQNFELPEMQGVKKNIFSMMRITYKEEGLFNYFKKGLTARIVSSLPTSVLMISAYETVKYLSVNN